MKREKKVKPKTSKQTNKANKQAKLNPNEKQNRDDNLNLQGTEPGSCIYSS